ncbi:MAG: HDOD domain-containing protein [Desulfobacteraceae bacterium]|nr:HDOD domain-containing protein [Desulfobacteraceae bacterium]MCB9494770.1 HDOD domain-containing protein [Desulfobacteraceae bacterium]
MKEKILKELEKRVDIPAFPNVLARLNLILNDENADLDDVAKVVMLDPVLSGKVLSYANSSVFGNVKVDSFSTAVARLGLDELKKIAYSLKVKDVFVKLDMVDIHSFWKHNLSVAELSQRLARYVNVSEASANLAYFSGLMHDIGIIVFFYIMPGAYLDFLENFDGTLPLEQAEMEAFGIDHAELGAFFLEKKWNLPVQIVGAVRGHHLPVSTNADIQNAAGLIHIADSICRSQGFSYGVECSDSSFRSEIWEMLGFSLDDVFSIIKDMEEAVLKAETILGIS